MRHKRDSASALGEVLKRRAIITDEQLRTALDEQDQRLRRLDESVHIGRILLEAGFVSESELLQAINEHYRLQLTSLPEDFEQLLQRRSRPSAFRRIQLRIPIWLQLAVAITLIVAVTSFLLNLVFIDYQKERLFSQTVKIGMVTLKYFETTVQIPLLEDNIPELNTLIKDVAQVEGLVYAIVVGPDHEIKAHSDNSKIGASMETLLPSGKRAQVEDDIRYFDYITPAGEHVLNLSQPIVFKNKRLGEVHVGVSLDFIKAGIYRASLFLFIITLLVFVLGIAVALFFGIRFSRPISKLVHATREVANGNFQYTIQLNRKDELGNLADAFNHMSRELWIKSLMQKSFVKYVGKHVFDMIMKNPEDTWLKGKTSHATILFADIRGFTNYSESRPPKNIINDLNEYFQIAGQTIMTYHGYIDKFIGDAVMGVFGVPIEHPDHILNAVRAALKMQRVFRHRQDHRNALLSSVGIGIHTGEVVSGNIGSAVKMEYTVVGDSVNVASHICNLAGPGEVFISQEIYDSIRKTIEVERMPSRRLKGKSMPTAIFKVVSIKEPTPL